MITLICSDDREDNIDHIYGLVSEGAAAGRRQQVIVPETHSHYAEQRLLAQCGCPIGEYAQVRTFSRASGRILEENRVKMTPVDAGGRMLIMYKAVRMAGTSLEYYTDSALRPETLSALASVVSELRSCLVSPETIAAAYQVIYADAKKERPEAGTSKRSVSQRKTPENHCKAIVPQKKRNVKALREEVRA